MRSVFFPFPGGVFLAADYSQLELRILTHMSGDLKLQQVLNSEGDVFKIIAGEWLGVPVDQVTAEDRQNAKQICYGMVYGIGAKALAEQLNIVEEEAARFMETFKSKYPMMKKFVSAMVQSCRGTLSLCWVARGTCQEYTLRTSMLAARLRGRQSTAPSRALQLTWSRLP